MKKSKILYILAFINTRHKLMKEYSSLFIFSLVFISCGKSDMKLDEKDSTKILSDYVEENVGSSSVSRVVFFADDNRDKTIQSVWIYYLSPEGEKKTLKLPVSEKERLIVDSIAAGKSSLVYDSISLRRENNLIFRFTQEQPVCNGRNLKDYDWTKIPDIFNKEYFYCMGISEVPLDNIIAYVIDFDESNESSDRHYVGLRTVSSRNGIDPSNRYNPDYSFKYSCFLYSSIKDQVYLAGYPIPVEPERIPSR